MHNSKLPTVMGFYSHGLQYKLNFQLLLPLKIKKKKEKLSQVACVEIFKVTLILAGIASFTFNK